MRDPITYLLNKLDNFFQPKYEGPSVKEIAEKMKPVPYKEVEDKLPWGFANTMKKILDSKPNKLEEAVD